MSLGIRSLWRARGCTIYVKGLSLIPREQHVPALLQRLGSRRCLSATPRDTKTRIAQRIILAQHTRLVKGKLPSPYIRALLRQATRRGSSFHPKGIALVKRPVRYPNKRKSYRSLRNHRRSVSKQYLYDQARRAALKPEVTLRSTVEFLLRHTPEFGEPLHFRIVIGKGAAAEARELLSGSDMHLSQICRKNESVIRIEEIRREGDGELVLGLFGSEDSVRGSLQDIVSVVGKITAVRIPDPTWKALLQDVWNKAPGERPRIRLLGNGEVAVDDKTMTVQTWFSDPVKYKDYRLTRRADELATPTEWTKASFEKYVAALVHGRVPTHLALSLYPNPPGHQETVISLLVDLFASEHARSATSVSALKMALNFIQSSGVGFHHAARTIFNLAELLTFPMDAEIFDIFLVGASKAGDLGGFNSILKMMVRKGHPPQSRAWIAFMEMLQDPMAKRGVAARLISKRLNHNPSILRAIGKQMAPVDLEHRLAGTFDACEYLEEQDKKYGVGWLDTITLNKIVEVFGAHEKLEACNALLDVVFTRKIVTPNAVTLNTMLTHARSLPQQVVMMRSTLTWRPRVVPDAVTYHLLFRAAWKRRSPNVLRVVWRYATLANLTTSKMRHTLTKLLEQERDLSARRTFLKTWEDVIFGQAELAELRATHGDLNAQHLMSTYVEKAGGMIPSVGLAAKLDEAFTMDVKLHKLLKEGTVISASDREAFSVEIPLGPKPGSPECMLSAPKESQDVAE
ncbi:hypothetical protein AAE478_007157 [Parahypoxylon ruwenzoriense]